MDNLSTIDSGAGSIGDGSTASSRSEGHEAAPVPVTLARILAFVDAHIAERDLTPARLGAAFAIPRTNLYRLLQPHGGVGRLVLARRLDRIARTLLEDPHACDDLKALALRFGFTTAPHFSRTFAQRFGMAPYRYRALARSGDAAWTRAQLGRIEALDEANSPSPRQRVP